MEEKITLDRKIFRSLASDTRISILKSLDVRRKMLTELSRELNMSPSTVKEHMDSLRKAGLVVLKEDGHKWKYYELAKDGRNILHPGDTKIWVVLSLSGLAFLITAYDIFRGSLMFAASQLKSGAPEAMREVSGAAAPASVQQLPYMDIIGLVLFAGIFAVALGYYLGSKKSWRLEF